MVQDCAIAFHDTIFLMRDVSRRWTIDTESDAREQPIHKRLLGFDCVVCSPAGHLFGIGDVSLD